jgi:aminoglycoside phosphotransferase (APT) family kinase protein
MTGDTAVHSGPPAAIATALQRWAHAHYDPSVTVADVRPMPGHAGLSFGFRLLSTSGDELDHLVVRMPPKGVRRSGNTDVLRQVPLLDALGEAGLPVAQVVWHDADERWFEVPYFMVRLLPGETYQVRQPGAAFDRTSCSDVIKAAVGALAQIHRFDWERSLSEWQPMRSLADEISAWTPLIAKAAEPAWQSLATETRDLLQAAVPASPVVGVFHGDFQTNNILFDGSSVVAVLDWEISGLGAQLLDLGWLLFMNDGESWVDNAGLERVPAFDEIVAWYAAAAKRDISLRDVAFYRALAGYRFGVISGLNVMLHRTGKRHDPEWERIALSVPAMFTTAYRLLRG